mmetsp:Transcript_35396/g.114608  ORF Transcript_35396/g.114608 Transcript_35396/m.114608 type:complete len:460 (-) Transcript_35396:205-1584(-)
MCLSAVLRAKQDSADQFADGGAGIFRELFDLFALQEEFVQASRREDDCKPIDAEEPIHTMGLRICEHLAPHLHSHGLLVHQLADGSVHDEDGERDAAHVQQARAAQQPRQHRRLSDRLAVDAHQEDAPQRNECERPHQHVVELDDTHCAQADDAEQCEQDGEGGARVLARLPRVQHHQAARHRAHDHLEQRREGREAEGVEERVVRVRPRGQRALEDLPSLQVVAVAQPWHEGHQGEEHHGLAQFGLLQGREHAQRVAQAEQGKGERRQEPRRGVPHLSGQREPRLQQEHGQEAVPQRDRSAVEAHVDPEEHGKEADQHEQVQRPKAHDPRHGELHGVVQALGAHALAQLCGRVCGNIAREHEEGPDHNIDLRRRPQQDCIAGGRRDEVPRSDIEDEEEPQAVERVDARLLRALRHRRLRRGRLRLPERLAALPAQRIEHREAHRQRRGAVVTHGAALP